MNLFYQIGKWFTTRYQYPPIIAQAALAVTRLGQPSESPFPRQLLPLALKTAARGFLNYNALQTHLDWVWPFWVVEQYDPASDSFLPRGFNGLSVNSTHRNWTASGLPGIHGEAIVEPRGLLTPYADAWSVDTWVRHAGALFAPSRAASAAQSLEEGLPFIATSLPFGPFVLVTKVTVALIANKPTAFLEARLRNSSGQKESAELIFSLRPCNPEGIAPVTSVSFEYPGYAAVDGALAWVGKEYPDQVLCSTLEEGDVAGLLGSEKRVTSATCDAGLATLAVIYRFTLDPGQEVSRTLLIPTAPEPASMEAAYLLIGSPEQAAQTDHWMENKAVWNAEMDRGMDLSFPSEPLNALFRQAKSTLLLLHDGPSITAGPFCYHHVCLRDAAFMLTALLKLNYTGEVRQVINEFQYLQQADGFFLSRDGEWDSAGQALWTMGQYYAYTRDREFLEAVYPSMARCAEWIDGKRLQDLPADVPHKGLLPAGLSAEHLGLMDYYYWDNFWGIAGLREVVKAARTLGFTEDLARINRAHEGFLTAVERSLLRARDRLGAPLIPASPYRKMDCGAIGSLCAMYPLEIFPPSDPRMECTLAVIRESMFYDGLFFQQNIHSGGNPSLTLQVAHCLQDRGDREAWTLFRRVLAAASPTGAYPEALHPRTGGGCMGDGHHGWAAAGVIHFLRDSLLKERDFRLDILPLAEESWFLPGGGVSCHRAACHFGRVDFALTTKRKISTLSLASEYRTVPDEVRVHVPFLPARVEIGGVPAEYVAEGKGCYVSCKPSVEELVIER